MKKDLLTHIRCPECFEPLELMAQILDENENDVLECGKGHIYPVIDGIPFFLTKAEDQGQVDTADSFSDKWLRFKEYGHEPVTWEANLRWFLDKYGYGNEKNLLAHLEGKKRILDAGCGTGRDIKILAKSEYNLVFGADISDAVLVANKHVGHLSNVYLMKADLNHLPFDDGFFDFIHSEGVIHHTPDPKGSFLSLVKKLRVGGEIQVYVYNKKAVLREILDTHLRALTTRMDFEECWRLSVDMALIGKYLAAVDKDLVVEEDLESLGIKAGRYNLQRFIYYNIFKCFWNEKYGLDHSAMVNLDWYHPVYAFRFSPEEIHAWIEETGLELKYFKEIPSALVFRAAKVKAG